MTPRNLRRILLGALRDAIAEAKAKHRVRVAEYGPGHKLTRQTLRRLDELREAYNHFNLLQVEERTARMFLRAFVTLSDEDRWHDVECEIKAARRYLKEDP